MKTHHEILHNERTVCNIDDLNKGLRGVLQNPFGQNNDLWALFISIIKRVFGDSLRFANELIEGEVADKAFQGFEIPAKGPSIQDDICVVVGRPKQYVVTKSTKLPDYWNRQGLCANCVTENTFFFRAILSVSSGGTINNVKCAKKDELFHKSDNEDIGRSGNFDPRTYMGQIKYAISIHIWSFTRRTAM
ncbi:hypothetical protein Tco_0692126 [Tanacetum coccineum]